MCKELLRINLWTYRPQLKLKALRDLDDILTDDNSVDYSSQQQPLEPNIQVETQNTQMSEAEDTSTSNPETVTRHFYGQLEHRSAPTHCRTTNTTAIKPTFAATTSGS